MQKLSLFTLVLCFSCAALAQQRSEAAARLIALQHFSKMYPIGNTSPVMLRSFPKNIHKKMMSTITAGDRKAPFYLFQDENNTHLIIVSGDERMQTLLGETDRSPNKEEEIPDGLCELLELFAREYSILQEEDITINLNAAEPQAPDVRPMITTTWGQGTPYNDKTPLNTPSGCVATAMAQIMNYYKYPAQGFGSLSYRSRTRGFSLSCDFSSTSFDWRNMTDRYNFASSSEQKKAVAELMYACGVGVAMDYNTSGSGAYDVDVPYALIHFFGYNPNLLCLQRDFYSSDEWLERLYADLKENRPVLYCGADSRCGGHAFVVDGCRSSDGMVHVNWGWDSSYDGYFVLSSLNPSGYRFSTNQSMVSLIHPSLTGNHEDVFYANTFSIKGELTSGALLKGQLAGAWCATNSATLAHSLGKFKGQIGIGIFDERWNLRRSFVEKELINLGIENLQADFSMNFVLNIVSLEDGTYFIAPYVRADNSEKPTQIRTLGGKTDAVKLNITDGMIDGEGSHEDDEPIDTDVAWAEDFELFSMPENMDQHSILGDSKWEVKKIVSSTTEQTPEAAHGNGYAYLKSNAISLSNQRDVCQLLTSDIKLPDGTFHLTFKMRKYAKRADSNDAINILIFTAEQGWRIVEEVSAKSSSSWVTYDVPISCQNSIIRLAFEGCVGPGSSLFLDHIIISKKNADSINPMSVTKHSDLIFSPLGISTSHLSRGLNIIRHSDGTIKKILVK